MDRRDALRGFGALGLVLALEFAAAAPLQQPAPAPELRGYASTALGQVHYRVQGPASGVPVLLIHQTPWFSIQYERAMPLLVRAGLRAIAPDTPGFGFSPTPPGQPALADYADALGAVLDAVGARRSIVIGHHTGAGLAALFAARHPDRVRCVVLNGVPLYTDAERLAKLQGAVVRGDAPLAADGSHLSERFARIRQEFMHGKGSLEGVQWSVISSLLASDRELKAYRALFAFPDMEATLRSIRAPTLLLADPDDMLLAATRRARELQPAFAYAELTGGGSHVIYDRPEEWSGAVLAFVDARCRD